jgi:hypothetical protein
MAELEDENERLREQIKELEAEEPAPLPPPPDGQSPLFVYGLLKPGELGHDQIRSYVDSTEEATINVGLRVLDGVPILDPDLRGDTTGWIVSFTDPKAGYSAVCGFEPQAVYTWTEMDAFARPAGGEPVKVNVLAVSPDVRIETDGGDVVDDWSAASDPLFCFGLPAVAAIATEQASIPFRTGSPQNISDWQRFYQVQAAFLLTCTVLERIAYFCVGNRFGPTRRVTELGKTEDFKQAAKEAGVTDPRRSVGRSDMPSNRRRASPGGSGFATRAYTIRSNLMHRGKSAYREAEIVRSTLLDLHDTLRFYLLGRVPGLRSTWEQAESGGAERAWRLKALDAIETC